MEDIKKRETIITVNGDTYELKYTAKRVEQIEELTGKGMLNSLYENNAMLPLSVARQFFSQALFNHEGNHVSPSQASDIFDKLVEEKGYMYVVQVIVTQLYHDVSFLFPSVPKD